jgi:hypothetical protein
MRPGLRPPEWNWSAFPRVVPFMAFFIVAFGVIAGDYPDGIGLLLMVAFGIASVAVLFIRSPKSHKGQ